MVGSGFRSLSPNYPVPRQILFRALRKDLRRWRIVAEKDRRNQQAWRAELRRALGQVA